MKKKSFIVLLSVILVLVSASTGVCFADSWPEYTISQATVSFTSDGFTLTASGANEGYIIFRNCSYANGSVSWVLNQSAANNSPSFRWPVTNSAVTCSFSDLSDSCYEITNGVMFRINETSGYYNFNITTTDPTWSEGQVRFYVPASRSVTYTFGGFNFNGNDVVSGSTTDTFHFSLPYGNALLISSESAFTINRRAYSISNTTYNYQKYVRASDNFSYRVNGSYQGVVENSSIVGTFGLSVFGSNDVMSLLIPWQPVNQNVLGRATSYNYYNASPDPTAEVSVSSGQSFMIWYPYYANNQDTSKINETNMEVSIDITHSASISFTTFPITGSTASSGEDAYIQNTASTSSGGSSSQSDAGDGSINVTFDNAPTAGGNHGQAPINDNNSILGVLSNLQNTLLGLFNKAIDGIHNLITLGSDFLQSVQIMFSWLPAELLVIITSGFVILLTIGVLKTLWR